MERENKKEVERRERGREKESERWEQMLMSLGTFLRASWYLSIIQEEDTIGVRERIQTCTK